MSGGHSRALRAPEVLQPSDVDCGPAVLQSACAGFGIDTHWSRLREACRTAVDGTSIDVVEALATELGLAAEQVLVPSEMLVRGEPELLPAIAVLATPAGAAHFVLLWRRWGPWIEVMDPAIGRCYRPAARLRRELYEHRQEVPTSAWHQWATSPEALQALQSRFAALGLRGAERDRIVQGLTESPTWDDVARWDAALRLVERLQENGLDRARCQSILLALGATPASDDRVADLLEPFASVRRGTSPGMVEVAGAVLVRLRGRAQPDTAGGPLDQAALDEVMQRAESPRAALRGLLGASGLEWAAALLAAAATGAIVALQALLFNALLGDSIAGVATRQRWQWLGGIGILLLLGVVFTWLRASLARRLGRRSESRSRALLFDKFHRLRDDFLSTRLPSDMIERLHATTSLRDGPATVGALVMAMAQLGAILLGTSLLFKSATAPACVAAALAVGVPALLQGLLRASSLRTRTLRALAGQLFLDTLQGLLPLRALAAEGPITLEHGRQIALWKQAAGAELRLALAGQFGMAIATLVAIACAVSNAADAGVTSGLLLLFFWLSQIPDLGAEIAVCGHAIARLEAIARRIDEALEAPSEPEPDGLRDAPKLPGAAVSFDRVGLEIGGRAVLQDISVTLRPGERVAILGESGAGKSTLLSLLLGWQEPTSGTIGVDGRPHDAASAVALRRETAWLDPAVALWNRSLAANLLYGSEDSAASVSERLETSGLAGLLSDRREGLGLELGENGRNLSGGEAQRVRWARAAGRRAPRLVIFDEPFRGLERSERDRLLADALTRYAGATFLCVLHDPSQLDRFDRVLHLAGGRLRSGDDPAPGPAPQSEERAAAWAGYRKLRLEAGTLSGRVEP